MKFRQLRFNQDGDSIVEVLITIAIISTILTGAFLVSQRSAIGVRDSQERGEMLQLLQGQVELVRALTMEEADTSGAIFSTSPKYFCVDGSVTPQVRVDMPLITSNLLDDSKYVATCGLGAENRYHVAVSYDSSTKIFTFFGHWDRIGGGTDQLVLSYRIYPGKVPLNLAYGKPEQNFVFGIV